jgi:hypothetical protein
MRKLTQADRDAGLTQEDVDLGMRGSVVKGNSDSAMRAKMKAEKEDNTSIVDQYRNYKTHPGAKAFPVKPSTKLAESSSKDSDAPKRRTSNDAIGDLVKKLGSGRVGTIPPRFEEPIGAKKGGYVKKMAKGGSVGSASKRADGCATKGKTRGVMR